MKRLKKLLSLFIGFAAISMTIGVAYGATTFSNVKEADADTSCAIAREHTIYLDITKLSSWYVPYIDYKIGSTEHSGNAMTKSGNTAKYTIPVGTTQIRFDHAGGHYSTCSTDWINMEYCTGGSAYNCYNKFTLGDQPGSGNIPCTKKQWNEGMSYKIAYNNNNGSGSIATQQVWLNNCNLNNGSNFSRAHYILSSWNTKADGSGNSYSLGQSGLTYQYALSMKEDETVTLYAQWTELFVSVTGTFNSWSTTANKLTLIDDNHFNGDIEFTGNDTTLFKIYSNKYNEHYGDGTTFNKNSTSFHQLYNNGANSTLTIDSTTSTNRKVKVNFDFFFQYDVSGVTKYNYLKIDQSVYQRKLTFKNGDTTVSTIYKYPEETLGSNIPSDPSPATGYTFDGWYIGSTKVTSSYEFTTSDVEAVAKYSKNEYTITYNTNGGTLDGTETTSYTVTDSVNLPTASNIEKTGYTFDGWFDNSGLSGSAITSIPVGSTGNKEYWAKWVSSTTYVTATFKNYNGTILQTGNVESGTTPVYSGPNPTKPEDQSATYTFTGWNPELGPITADTIYTAQFSSTAKQYTIRFINSDERGGQATADYVYNTTVDVSAFATISAIFNGNLDTEPLGRYYVGLKTDPKDTTTYTSITVTQAATYYVCYAFEEADQYMFSFDGETYTELDDHRDSYDSEPGYLQVYYTTTDASFTSGQTFHLKYNGTEITKDSTNKLTFDESSNIAANGKVRATGTGNVTIRFIYSEGKYSYQVYLGGLPQDSKFYISVDGILTELTYNNTTDEYYVLGIQMETGNVINAYNNGFYSEIWMDESVSPTYFIYNTSTKMIECQMNGSYDAYLKKESGEHKKFYLAPHGLNDAENFAKTFNTNFCAICELTKAGGDIAPIKTEWSSQATAFANLADDATRAWLTNADAAEGGTVLEEFAAKYDFIFAKYNKSFTPNLDNFANRTDAVNMANAMAKNHSYYLSDSEDQSVLIIVIAASATLLATSAAALLLLKKKKKAK